MLHISNFKKWNTGYQKQTAPNLGVGLFCFDFY